MPPTTQCAQRERERERERETETETETDRDRQGGRERERYKLSVVFPLLLKTNNKNPSSVIFIIGERQGTGLVLLKILFNSNQSAF